MTLLEFCRKAFIRLNNDEMNKGKVGRKSDGGAVEERSHPLHGELGSLHRPQNNLEWDI